LSAHKLDFVAKESYCLQAIEYAKLAKDRNAQASAMVQLAVAYYYYNRPEKALDVYEEALLYISQLTPLMQSRVYMGAAEAFGKNERIQEALRYIGLAYGSFPQKPENDPSYRYADFGLFALLEHDGLIHLSVGQPREALNAFAQTEGKQSIRAIPERIRLEMVNYQAEAAIDSNDQERYVQYLEEGITGAVAINSQKRLNEVISTLSQKLPSSWSQSPKIRHVVEEHGLSPYLKNS
jgi:tetratricopeptide (TPR) repeat protein